MIVSNKNKCSGTILAVEQGEQTIVIGFDTTLWYNKLGHISEKVI